MVGAEGPATEIVFGVMYFSHRGQQHRYVITYDEASEEFGVGAWTAWRRFAAAGVADPAAFDLDVYWMCLAVWGGG